MKWLIAVFAALMFTGAQAADTTTLSAQGRPGHTCGWYRGSFDIDGLLGEKTGIKPIVICKLIDGVGSRCKVANHDIPNIPSTLEFEGNFMVFKDGSGVVIDGDSDVFVMELLCSPDLGCFRFRMHNGTNKLGFQCDMKNWSPPKPVPQAPPLLRKNAPEYKDPVQKPAEIGV